MDFKISVKIMLVYFLILIISVFLSSLIYQKIYYNITSKKVSEISLQTLYSIKSNINSMLDNVSYNSRIILSNNDVQNILKDSKSSNDVFSQRTINSYLASLLDSMPHISSIYIFDNFGNKYGIDKRSIKSFKFDRIEEAAWYKEVLDKKGYYVLKLNAGGEMDLNSDENVVSLIRDIYNLELQKQKIGTLMINISESGFEECYKEIVGRYEISIMLLDEKNQSIIRKDSTEYSDIIPERIKVFNDIENNSVIRRVKNQDYIFSSLNIKEYNWKIISSIPFVELSKELSIFNLVAVIVILINGVLLFIGAIFVSRLITNPINKLLKSMKEIENGKFNRVDISTGKDEIGKLRDGYNIMISEIEKLINKVIDEQKRKRKAELSALQAQIKPHFLYNTLDAMGHLALTGKCDQVYEALEALGSYYRTSLSKGSEVISIRQELDLVKDYITLQKLRYGDFFTVQYKIDERVYDYRIPKLVLQPLVENALYHGIKPKGEKGNIWISAVIENNYIKMAVEDDGVGMTQEELAKVMDSKIDINKSSFGLRCTIERLRIFYAVSDVYFIESKKRRGTKVTIKIPIKKDVKNG